MTLYLNGRLCPDLDTLKSLFKNKKDDEGFKEEILANNADGYLKKWLKEQGSQVDLPKPEEGLDDVECFKAIYEAVVGDVDQTVFASDISSYAELEGVALNDGDFVELTNQNVSFDVFGEKLTFRFKYVGSGKNTFKLSLRNGSETIETKEVVFGLDKEQEVSFKVTKFGLYDLYEGESNLLCEVSNGEKRVIYSSDNQHHLNLYAFYEEGQLKYMTEIITKEDVEISKEYLEKIEYVERYYFEVVEFKKRFSYFNVVRNELNVKYKDWEFYIPNQTQLDCVFENRYWKLQNYFSKPYDSSIYANRNDYLRYLHGLLCMDILDNNTRALCLLSKEMPKEVKTIYAVDGFTPLRLYRLSDDDYVTEVIPLFDSTFDENEALKEYLMSENKLIKALREYLEIHDREILLSWKDKPRGIFKRKRRLQQLRESTANRLIKSIIERMEHDYKGWAFEQLKDEIIILRHKEPYKNIWENFNVLPTSWDWFGDNGKVNAFVMRVKEKKVQDLQNIEESE